MKATDTGYGVSGARAMGMFYPEEQRLYNDPISEKLLSGGNKLVVRLMHIPPIRKLLTAYYERAYPGLLGYFFCRFRFYDDVVKACLENNELDSIVNLGAGMDPRAYYVPGIENVRYYEVDHPAVIKRKKEKIKRIMGKCPEHVTYVSVDFNAQDVEGELQKAGFEPFSRTLFIWESVSAYLTEEANDAIFSFVSRAASGSKIAFSYATESLLKGENLNNKVLEKLHRIMVKKHQMVVHGFDPNTIEEYLSKFGLALLDHVGPEEFKKRYEIRKRMGLDVIEVERLVLAEVK